MTEKKQSILENTVILKYKYKEAFSASLLAESVALSKAGLYSHFKSMKDAEENALEYCRNLFNAEKITVSFKTNALDIFDALFSGILDLLQIPVMKAYILLCLSNKTEKTYIDHYKNIHRVFLSRIKVATEYCIQNSYLEMKDTDIASALLCGCLENTLTTEEIEEAIQDLSYCFCRLFRV